MNILAGLAARSFRTTGEAIKDLIAPRGGDLNRLHCLARTGSPKQEGHVLESDRHLSHGEVERVRLGPPPVQQRAQQLVVEPNRVTRSY